MIARLSVPDGNWPVRPHAWGVKLTDLDNKPVWQPEPTRLTAGKVRGMHPQGKCLRQVATGRSQPALDDYGG